MSDASSIQKIAYNGATATTLGNIRVFGIGINKTLNGNIIVYEGSTAIANFATGATGPTVAHNIPHGVRYANFGILLATGTDDVDVFTSTV